MEKMNEFSERYCGGRPPTSVVRRMSPMKRVETYGRSGKLSIFISTFACAYPNASLQREEYSGYVQIVVRKRATPAARFRYACSASEATFSSGLCFAIRN